MANQADQGDEDEGAGGAPAWMVTFGDMMALLLTFFIMLVSLSEIREEEKFQAVVDSLRRQFGYEATVSTLPGEQTPSNSPLQFLMSLGRAKRQDTTSGGNEVQAVKGENPTVQTIRTSRQTTLGGVVYFDEDSPELSEQNMRDLDVVIQLLVGKPQKIEIRGHTSRKPADTNLGVRDHWDLAYQRCYNTMQYLIRHGIEPGRIRLGSAAAHEPLDGGIDPVLRRRNARVEILLWDERVSDVMGGATSE
jgi:chemotaxis protein MotB